MKWTDEDTKELLSLKDQMDYDPIRIKTKIKDVLLNNRWILHIIAALLLQLPVAAAACATHGARNAMRQMTENSFFMTNLLLHLVDLYPKSAAHGLSVEPIRK